MEDNKTVEQAAENDRSFGAFLKFAGIKALDGAKWLYGIPGVKSEIATRVIQKFITHGASAAIVSAILEKLLGHS